MRRPAWPPHPAQVHLLMVTLWALLLAPTLLWWWESILWVAIMNLYANLAGHWSAYQAAHAEERLVKKFRKLLEEVRQSKEGGTSDE